MVSKTLFDTLDIQGNSAKSRNAFKTISEVADLLDVPQHVLRFWETKFTQIRPMKRNGGRRFYRPEDIEVLLQIKNLLYKQGYTIKGAKKAFEQRLVGNDNTPSSERVHSEEVATSHSKQDSGTENTSPTKAKTSVQDDHFIEGIHHIKTELCEIKNMLSIRKALADD